MDPLHLYLSMVGSAYFLCSNGHTLNHIWQTDVVDPSWQDAHRALGAEMLRPLPTTRAPGSCTLTELRCGGSAQSGPSAGAYPRRSQRFQTSAFRQNGCPG
ncbi:hypothetical protein [Rhabdonatronobacter sediminivivens]|uniref:hypothetical protein n=1 Tax=Rhabdonatronobacter sediminivivens TaxID=2743469 RepID=UPI003899DA2C